MRKSILSISIVGLTLLSLSVPVSAAASNTYSANIKQNTKKKHHKLTQHDKDVLKLRKEILSHKKAKPKKTAPKADKIANGYNYTKDKITDYNTYEQVYLQTELKAINDYRNSQGVASLTLDEKLSNLAAKRAEQNYEYRNDSWYDGHRDQNGDVLAWQLASNYGINTTFIAENTHIGEFTGEDDILEDPITAAKAEINEIINYGKGEAHYDTMVNPVYKTIGLGIYIGPNQGKDTAGGTAQEYSN